MKPENGRQPKNSVHRLSEEERPEAAKRLWNPVAFQDLLLDSSYKKHESAGNDKSTSQTMEELKNENYTQLSGPRAHYQWLQTEAVGWGQEGTSFTDRIVRSPVATTASHRQKLVGKTVPRRSYCVHLAVTTTDNRGRIAK